MSACPPSPITKRNPQSLQGKAILSTSIWIVVLHLAKGAKYVSLSSTQLQKRKLDKTFLASGNMCSVWGMVMSADIWGVIGRGFSLTMCRTVYLEK